MSVIVGINLSHDSSVAIAVNGQVKNALALERLTRVKRGVVPLHSYAAAMAHLVQAMLSDAGLDTGDVDYWIATSTEARDQAEEELLLDTLGLVCPPTKRLFLPHPSHHLAHASAAFYSSGFASGTAIIVDAYGSRIGDGRERETIFKFGESRPPEAIWREVRPEGRIAGRLGEGRVWIPRELSGVGEIYRTVTLALGFRERGTTYDDAGKTMGLAPYGRRISDDNLFITFENGQLDTSSAVSSLIDLGFAKESDEGVYLVPRQHGAAYEDIHRGLAMQVQNEFEEACLALVGESLKRTGERSLVLSGGCFLNSVLNTRIAGETEAERLFVYPAATDDGNAAGAALYASNVILGEAAERTQITHVYLGPSRTKAADLAAKITSWGLAFKPLNDDEVLTRAAAKSISDGEIIGWFQDRGEFGPRSLGARSILCHPGIGGMADRLNARVKFREGFRPFAGSVLAEHANKWFDMPVSESPFMLFVCPVWDGQRAAIAEIVHVDGTCRVQTVSEDLPGPFRMLLERFEAITGLSVILNTSLNVRGMPIAETVEDALDCLYGSRLDRLYVGNFQVEPPDFLSLVPTLADTANDSDGNRLFQGSAATQTSVKSGSRVAILRDLVGLAPTERALVGVIDGTSALGELATTAMTDHQLDDVVDAALSLRRLGVLRWGGLPQAHGPRLPLQQYDPARTSE